ncbi:transmembrane protein 62-like [Contarinia nasturtii]|uniref:transmembrane protein 62-like n=1 Tax=Contarinia nasturtii TaxID=265458 RepID=UPI0012D37DAD|nr:transmembrane protein 62-like [Contarinia nasturtii]XP_031628846.1 transmembrane protein 62-like [Contarinia nasturtii]
MRSTFVLIIFVGILSVFMFVTQSTNNFNKFENRKFTKTEKSVKLKTPRLDDKADRIFWFLQISDIHISIFKDKQRIDDFRQFAHETLDTIKPRVVLASGDLTNAEYGLFHHSRQYEDEWKIYNEIITTANVRNKTIWMDMRGNHDNFNIPLSMSNISHFKRYSVQGGKHQSSFMKLIDTSAGELYAFIAIDVNMVPGPKLPFNFVGVLTQNETEKIEHLVNESKRANYTIWFGHYPTSCIATKNNENRSIKQIISEVDTSLTYMCGHLHTFLGLIPRMYALQENRYLELEVADWKKCRTYRVAAIDNGLFSFVDVKHGVWPVILITNPKHSLFQIPHRNEDKIQIESTHIRIMAFSPSGIKNCQIIIDNEFGKSCKQVNDNLFVVEWDPLRYQDGLHYISAIVVDNDDREQRVMQPFRLDRKQTLKFDMMAEFILKTELPFLLQTIFWVSLTLFVLPLILLRIWHDLIKVGLLRQKRGNSRYSMSIVQQYSILTSVNRIFWPIIVYCIYLAVGPWMVCEIIDGHYGIAFAWGIYLDGGIFPSPMTFLYGITQIVMCQMPMIWIFSKRLTKRYYEAIGIPSKKSRGKSCSSRQISNIIFYGVISIEFVATIMFGIFYDAFGYVVGISRTYSLIMNIVLWHLAGNVPDNALR